MTVDSIVEIMPNHKKYKNKSLLIDTPINSKTIPLVSFKLV
jgi:hypothetical protein